MYSYLDMKEGRLFLAVITVSIVTLWFRGHSYLAAGDVGLCSPESLVPPPAALTSKTQQEREKCDTVSSSRLIKY